MLNKANDTFWAESPTSEFLLSFKYKFLGASKKLHAQQGGIKADEYKAFEWKWTKVTRSAERNKS